MSFLDEVISEKRKQLVNVADNMLAAKPVKRPFFSLIEALNARRMSLICEVKRASPSNGFMRQLNAPEVAKEYAMSGASAISVLTEDKHFGGSLTDLLDVTKAVEIPVLRKDFIIDEAQLHESLAYGADAVLLIASILRESTQDFVKKAHSIGLECIVEIHGEDEVDYALESGAKIIGVNNRDLETLEVDLSVSEEIIPLVKDGHIVVSESGIKTREDVIRVKTAGANAVLVGTSLVTASSISEKMEELMSA